MHEAPAATEKQRVIALMGPTASGKTALAVDLAEHLGGEVISVDSALVYRGMDIGTAKPSEQEKRGVPHHLIDIRHPAEPYSAKDFYNDAKVLIEAILKRGKVPILAGGTMLYFKALIDGLTDMPAADLKVREQIECLAQEKGWPHIHQLLAEVDPESAARLHPNHSQRLSRALEVYRSSGKTMTQWHQGQDQGLADLYDWHQLAVAPRDRAILHQRISLRFEQMIAQGFKQEVEALYSDDSLHKNLPAIRAVGYRQMWEHLDGLYDYPAMLEKSLASTRQLAKRQLTWLRSWHDLSWVYTQDDNGKMLSSCEILALALNNLYQKAI